MKNLCAWVGLAMMLGVGCSRPITEESPGETAEKVKVVVVSAAEIDPIIQLRKGFAEELLGSAWGRQRDIDIDDRFNAQGDQKLFGQVADAAIGANADVIYVLGTPLAQAIQSRRPDLLLVQGAATDPVTAGLADSWDGSGRNYLATSDLPPVQTQIELIRVLAPKVRRLGVLYNPGETNSVAVVQRLREAVGQQLILVERGAASTTEIPAALQSLSGRVDALYIPPDNTIYSNFDLVGNFGESQSLPIFTTDTQTLDRGATAAVALDFRRLGQESARLVIRVLKGEDPSGIPIGVTEVPEIIVDGRRARALHLNVAAAADRGWTVRE